MRRVYHALFKIALAFGRGAVAWIPTLVLLVLGGLYIFSCLEALAAPGTGIRYVYASRSGSITLQTETYAIDLVRHRVDATGITLKSSNGELLASADAAHVDIRDGTMLVDLRGANATIVRRKDGSLSAFDLLPPDKPGEPPPTFSIKLDEINVNFRDETAQPAVSQLARLTGLAVDAHAGQTVVSGDLRVGTSGVTRLTGSIGPKEDFLVRFSTDSLNIAPLRPLLTRFYDQKQAGKYASWSAESLVFQGWGSVGRTGKRPIAGQAEGSIQGRQVSLADTVRNASVSARAKFRGSTMTLEASVTEANRSATASGFIDWSAGPARSAGLFSASAKDSKVLWPELRQLLPKELTATGLAMQGSFGYDGKVFSVNGPLTADLVGYQSETFKKVKSHLAVNSTDMSLNVDQATWRDAVVKGWLSLGLSSQALKGHFATVSPGGEKVVLGPPESRAVLLGRAAVVIEGTTTKPLIAIDSSGTGLLQRKNVGILDLGEFQARLRWSGSEATIDRAFLRGPSGVVTATGSIDTTRGLLAVDIEGGGIDISAFAPQLSGGAYVNGKLTGTFEKPTFLGQAQAYNVKSGETVVPSVTTRITFSGQQLGFSGLEARLGLGKITGAGSLDIKSQAIVGTFTGQDLFLADLPVGDVAVGRFDIDKAQLTGTLSKPVVALAASGKDISFQGLNVKSASLSATVTPERASAIKVAATVGSGTVEGSGFYAFANGAGQFDATVTEFPLEEIPVDKSLFAVLGSVSGVAKLRSAGKDKWEGSADLKTSGAAINGFEAGSGDISVTLAGSEVRAKAAIGSIAGLLEVPEALYDLESGEYSGHVIGSNLDVGGIVRAASADLKIDDQQTKRAVQNLEGSLNTDVTIEGDKEGFSVRADSLTATGLSTLGTQLGDVAIHGTYSPSGWNLTSLLWKRPLDPLALFGESQESGPIEAIVTVKGSGVGDKSVNISGDIVNFDPQILSLFKQDGPSVAGRVASTFVLSGPVDSLTGRASLNVRQIAIRGEDSGFSVVPVTIDTQEIELNAGTLTAVGDFYLKGLPGQFSATVPLDAFEQGSGSMVKARAELSQRTIQDLKEYLPLFDFEKSAAAISATVDYIGNATSSNLNGTVKIGPDSQGKAILALNGVETRLTDLELALTVADDKAKLTGSGLSSLGGTVDVNAEVNLAPLLQGQFGEDMLQDMSVNGSLSLDEWRVREKIRLPKPVKSPGAKQTFVIADRHSDATWTGKITLGGTLAQPRLGGEVEANGLVVNLPAEIPPGTAGTAPPINPIFDNLRIVAGGGSNLKVPTGDIKLNGAATIEGPLDALRVTAPFTVESGTITLPSSRIKLEDGGRVNVSMGVGDSPPRVDVNLTGTSIVTVRQTSERFQTYRLNLEVRGDLLDPNGVSITGTSDPPDLSAEQIRAIVGQQDFIETMLGSVLGTRSRQDLGQGLFQLALPNLTQGLTQDFARALNLDYLILDYNPFQGAVVRLGKTLGKGLTVQASRQITDPAFGPTQYEVGLTYAPPASNDLLSKLRLSLTRTETVPWKIGLSYSTKF